jgi:GNAT superfamily N-acetyltransferase/predicted kinase
MISLRQVSLDDATARALWAEEWAELFRRYGVEDADTEIDFEASAPPEATITNLLAVDEDGAPVGTGMLVWSAYDTGAGSAEVKRVYVRPEHRGHGHSRVIMGALEHAGWRAGAVRLVLETGTAQPEALSLYERTGYSPIPPYGPYREDERSRCFAKELPTRVLIINGTIGAGKSSVAVGVHDVLTERGARSACIDADALCQAQPHAVDDRHNQALLFQNLAGVGPNYRRAGFGYVVLARVVEDPDDRGRYSRAFGTRGLPADVTIARVTAPQEVRMQRIRAREPEGPSQDWGFARTIELEDALDALDLDDVTVDNVGRSAKDTAAELLAEIGW